MSDHPQRRKNRATLKQVADRAGVSATTASLVLNGKAAHRRISAETHIKVQAAAQELNYAPNLLVRSLRKGRTHIISFYNGFREREASDLYIEKLGSAIEVFGGKAGYDILVHCNYDRSPQETYQFLNGGLADGVLLFCPHPNDPMLPLLRKSSLPVVLIGARDPQKMFSSVADNVESGMKMATDAIVLAGHTAIGAFTSSLPRRTDPERRVSLLQRYLKERGLDLLPNGVLDSSKGIEKGFDALMNLPQPPTVIFCWHDFVAYEVLKLCEARGIRVPDELSLVGYDGLIWPDRTSHIVTSILVDLDFLAEKSVEFLDGAIRSSHAPYQELEPGAQFLRGTTLFNFYRK